MFDIELLFGLKIGVKIADRAHAQSTGSFNIRYYTDGSMYECALYPAAINTIYSCQVSSPSCFTMDYPRQGEDGKYFEVEIITTDGIFIDQLLIDDEVVVNTFCISDAQKEAMISENQHSSTIHGNCETPEFNQREEWAHMLLDRDGTPYYSYGIMVVEDSSVTWAINEGAIVLNTCYD